MTDKRNAVLWALGWWLVRRQIRRRAALALAGATGAVTVRRRGRWVVRVLALAAVAVGALVAWRRLAGGGAPLAEPLQGAGAGSPDRP